MKKSAFSTQVHFSKRGQAPSPALLTPLSNSFNKPQGGFWTSTYLGQPAISAWAETCRREELIDDFPDTYLLTVDPSARVLEIDGLETLRALMAQYPYHKSGYEVNSFLDYEALAREYDGLHLTKDGQATTNYTKPTLMGWGCESTVWTRWVFREIKAL
jgi:hypothetical protein